MMILVTGGTGYIGSHTTVELLLAGHEVIILDDLSNSEVSVIDRIAQIAGRRPRLVVGDICDYATVRAIFDAEHIDAVIHFAAKKAVEESMRMPDLYYRVNVGGMATLCQVMRETGVSKFVFSSSAAAYGEPDHVPVTEDASLHPLSVYGTTKKLGEELLASMVSSSHWSVSVLRYFNPVGAHTSGLIGENPRAANNLLPMKDVWSYR
jgi:UDP-glucose 4-epimerase